MQLEEHKLAVCKEAKLISKKKRRLEEERRLVVEVEVKKLVDVGFIREVWYTT